jgi:sulfate transport system ATP-binding protein
MGFLGPVTKVHDQLVRPHELRLSQEPIPDGVEAMVKRVVHLGFEVRVELELSGGESAFVQLTRAETDELELREGDVVYLRRPLEQGAQASAAA